jgi:RNAse P Rpr2/Rpp21/SNM1 subunit family protein
MGKETAGELRAMMRYQDAASYLLVNTCPTIAAHLQHEITEAALRNRINMPLARKHQICGACGSIATLSTAESLQMEPKICRSRSKYSSKAEKTDLETRRSIITTCKMCFIQTKTWVEPSKSCKVSQSAKQKRQPGAIPTPTTPKITRKQRQTQKKQEGSLQAMLAKSKTSTAASQSTFSLGLMDFMKSGSG